MKNLAIRPQRIRQRIGQRSRRCRRLLQLLARGVGGKSYNCGKESHRIGAGVDDNVSPVSEKNANEGVKTLWMNASYWWQQWAVLDGGRRGGEWGWIKLQGEVKFHRDKMPSVNKWIHSFHSNELFCYLMGSSSRNSPKLEAYSIHIGFCKHTTASNAGGPIKDEPKSIKSNSYLSAFWVKRPKNSIKAQNEAIIKLRGANK